MGCSTCSKCKWIRNSAFCGTTKLTEKQLYAKNGFCSTYKPKEEAQVTPQPHPCKDDFEKHLHGNKDGILYHHYCVKCGWDWWTDEAFPNR